MTYQSFHMLYHRAGRVGRLTLNETADAADYVAFIFRDMISWPTLRAGCREKLRYHTISLHGN